MSFSSMLAKNNALLHEAIARAYYSDETELVQRLVKEATLSSTVALEVSNLARKLVQAVRAKRLSQGGLDAFLLEYKLSSDEGIALMCVAEALLRIPDAATADALLEDKIGQADWASHLGQSSSFFVNASTWGLLLTGRLLKSGERAGLSNALYRLMRRGGAPLIRRAVKQAMQLLGRQFVMGETIAEALKRAKECEALGYRFSYDMLGEAARTQKDAERYFQAYQAAIRSVGQAARGKSLKDAASISIKLSALHPRYEWVKRDTVVPILIDRVKSLVIQAKNNNIGVTIDAEEADRLDISLEIIGAVFCAPELSDWEGFGLAVQAYQKRTPFVIDWLIALSQQRARRWMVRLVKGAYWDAEIKNAQVKGLKSYPVFTRKTSTDICFVACAKKLLAHTAEIYPQFATHNVYTLATILQLAGRNRDFEFQCLHGMGYTLYEHIVGPDHFGIPCRVYAPVGGHGDLLAYLVRRLLENGANASFVHQIADPAVPIEDLLLDPVDRIARFQTIPHPKIPLPVNLYGETRKNSLGVDFTDTETWSVLSSQIAEASKRRFVGGPLIDGRLETHEKPKLLVNPAQTQQVLGELSLANLDQVERALESARHYACTWAHTPIETRAACLNRAADLLEQRLAEFMDLATREGGKTLPDALAECREAIDYCRYYAARACCDLGTQSLPGPTGETNYLSLTGRGVIACISPWNFPLAIFMGQVTAALVAGNTVLAKPAGQTSLIALAAVRLLHEAGIPAPALHLIPASGAVVGPKLALDPRISGIVFTGSTETAWEINRGLASRRGPIVPLIAETGGQNAMIVDSSALIEQVVADALLSAFGSAGQRCSALRVLFLQQDTADQVIDVLCGAMAELKIGDPARLDTDIGPVIDGAAKQTLQAHADHMRKEAKLLYQCSVPNDIDKTHFFGPALFELDSLERLEREVFGPILHVIRYTAKARDAVVSAINRTGYGLTLGIQSRIQETIDTITRRAHAGNQYVNRSMIGAVVGVQPFGGEGLSGTGPKAGGPHYLPRLCLERTLSTNTTAAGGNASLLCLEE